MVADRYVALAIWPAILLLVSLIWRFKPPLRAALVLLVALPWLYQTVERPRDWRSEIALIDSDFRTYPEFSVTAIYKITYYLKDGLRDEASVAASHISPPEMRNITSKWVHADRVVHVDTVSANNPHEAIRLLLELEPLLDQQSAQAKWDTSRMFLRPKLIVTLSDEWKALSKEFPNDAAVRYNTGQYLFNMKYFEEAAIHLRAVSESKDTPEYARGTVFKTLGLALLGSGQLVEAEASLRKSLAQSPPDLQAYCGLTEVYKLEGRIEDAVQAQAKCISNDHH